MVCLDLNSDGCKRISRFLQHEASELDEKFGSSIKKYVYLLSCNPRYYAVIDEDTKLSILFLKISLHFKGSHDSLSFSVSRRSSVSPDAPQIAKLLSKVCGPLLKRIIYNWCVTQNANLEQQFSLGIRYYDLRIAKKGSEIHSCHALYGMDILKALAVLKKMLDIHNQEVVILDFQHIYDFEDTDHTFLTDMIHLIFGDKICPPLEDISRLTLRWMQENNFQVIVVYRDNFVHNVPNFWPSSKWVTLWPNTINITQLYKYLVQTLKTRSPDSGFVSQCLFTPPPRFIACHLWSTLKEKCAIDCDMEIKSMWLQNQRSLSPKGVNVVIADFIDFDEFNFCSSVIDINKKSLQSTLSG